MSDRLEEIRERMRTRYEDLVNRAWQEDLRYLLAQLAERDTQAEKDQKAIAEARELFSDGSIECDEWYARRSQWLEEHKDR